MIMRTRSWRSTVSEAEGTRRAAPSSGAAQRPAARGESDGPSHESCDALDVTCVRAAQWIMVQGERSAAHTHTAGDDGTRAAATACPTCAASQLALSGPLRISDPLFRIAFPPRVPHNPCGFTVRFAVSRCLARAPLHAVLRDRGGRVAHRAGGPSFRAATHHRIHDCGLCVRTLHSGFGQQDADSRSVVRDADRTVVHCILSGLGGQCSGAVPRGELRSAARRRHMQSMRITERRVRPIAVRAAQRSQSRAQAVGRRFAHARACPVRCSALSSCTCPSFVPCFVPSL